jgi:hypothetical protein
MTPLVLLVLLVGGLVALLLLPLAFMLLCACLELGARLLPLLLVLWLLMRFCS